MRRANGEEEEGAGAGRRGGGKRKVQALGRGDRGGKEEEGEKERKRVQAGTGVGADVRHYCDDRDGTGHVVGWGPHEYFNILDEMNGSAQPTNTLNPLSAQVMEAETVYQQAAHNDQTGSYSYGAYNDGISLLEMEAGRK
ncbi:hypothetical protein AAC387_Pa11g0870 [Persea americana]